MGMLFRMTEEGRIDGNDWKGIPEFKVLNEPEFRSVVLIYDNQSMFRRMSVEQREERVMKSVIGEKWQGFKLDERYITASFMYRAIDYDHDIYMLDLYNSKLLSLSNMLSALEISDDVQQQKKYDIVNKNIAAFSKTKNELEMKIDGRGKISKNFKVVLSGFEKFQERAVQMRNESTLFRNLKTVE